MGRHVTATVGQTGDVRRYDIGNEATHIMVHEDQYIQMTWLIRIFQIQDTMNALQRRMTHSSRDHSEKTLS